MMKLLLLLPLGLWAQTLSLYEVPKMHCPLCTVAIKKSLLSLEGVEQAQVRLATKEAHIIHDDAIDDATLKAAIERVGYEGILRERTALP
ncbi:MAG: heavy-metal-associated domain-containing protein [Campylobacterales bacterium]|nr:heavy-metal-associated domain-containing protein [Campylobacterales bacterium]